MSPIQLGHRVGRARPSARNRAGSRLPVPAVPLPAASSALTLPPGFEQTTAISGLNEPTDVEVAPGGRVFVTEKSGYIRTYDSLSDPTAHTFADLRTKVHNFSSRGLLALAVDPDYPAEPYIYVHYVLDAPIGGTPPLLGQREQRPMTRCFSEGDCLVSVRVSKLRVEGEDVSGPEQVLVNDWCQQFQFHPGWGHGVRRRRQPVRVGRRRRALGDLGLRPARRPAQPVRRPARQHAGIGAHPADRGGRPAARPGPAHERRPTRAVGLADPDRSRHRSRACSATRCSPAERPTPGACSRTASATRSGSRCGRAPTTSGWRTAAAVTSRSSTGSPTRPTPCATSAGPATRAAWTRTGTRTRASARAATTRT